MLHDATYCPRRRAVQHYTGHLTHHPADYVVRRNILHIKLPNTTRYPTICPNQHAAVNHATQLASKHVMLCNILSSRLANEGCCPASKTTKLLNIIPEKVLTTTCYISQHTAKHDMLHNSQPNTICCTICRQTQQARKHIGYYPECCPTQHAAQHTVQHATQITPRHNILPNLPVNTIFC